MNLSYRRPSFVVTAPHFGQSQSLLNRPSAIKAVSDEQGAQVKLSGPLGHVHCPAIVSDVAILPGIVCLLRACRPTAVLGKVTKLVVHAFKCVSLLIGWSHVLKKVPKRPHPAVTHRNSSVAVVVVTGICGVTTSQPHFAPDVVDVGFAVPVTEKCGTGPLFSQAATTVGTILRSPQTVSYDNQPFPTVALAKPSVGAIRASGDFIKCHELAKTHASNVIRRLAASAMWGYNGLQHGLSFQSQDRVTSDWRLHPSVAQLILTRLRYTCKAYQERNR